MTHQEPQTSKISAGQDAVVAEFRANGGKVSGFFADKQLLLLTAVGAKSGIPRTTPLTFEFDGDSPVVFAAAAGAPKNPAWFHNLVAHPEVTVEIGTESFTAKAVVVTGKERDVLLERLPTLNSVVGRMQTKTTREIPGVILERLTTA
jgi:deazaflavin-dependent oxidoreductase (nitroreductase family)